jgi:hypothetical protein
MRDRGKFGGCARLVIGGPPLKMSMRLKRDGY